MNQELETLFLRGEQFSHLKEIIKTILNVDVKRDRNRMQHTVNCKMIYANILKECGYGCSVISKSIVMNHATILHYFKTFPFYVKTDVALRNNYERIKSEFNKEYDPVYYLSENELKNEVFSLKIKNKDLSSDLETCQSRLTELEKHKARFETIFKLVEERTKPGTEDHVLKKLNHFFNGVYTK
jgi:hypothetical protein